MSQILANAGAVTLTKYWYQSGTPTDVGDVTIGVVDGNGTEVVASGTPTTNNADGSYTYTLADQASPTELVLTWTDDSTDDNRVDRIEVVGSLLFTENQARTFAAKADATSALIPLASSTEYPDAVISDERTRITDDLEYWTARSWILRYARAEFTGNNTSNLRLDEGRCRTFDGYALHRPGRFNDIGVVLSVTVNGDTVSVSDVATDPLTGKLTRKNGGVWPSSSDPWNVVVEYVYGLPYLVDGADRIGLKLLIDRLVPSAWPDRVLSADTEYGTTRFVQPGGPMGNVSRLPEVNDWVHRHDGRVLVG